MNKTMLCIELLQLLTTKNVRSKNELAEILETNPRNIIEYIKTLQDCGYDITSVKGVYGGYHLNKDSLLPTVQLKKEEIAVLKASCSFLEHQSDFLDYSSYVKAISKVLFTHTEAEAEPITIIDRFPLLMPKEEIKSRYESLSSAENLHYKCKISYLSTKNKSLQHVIHPYKIFVYNGSWVVLAWNETVNDFGYFKLNRIEDIELLSNRFQPLRTFNATDYIDGYGMKQNGKYIDIKVELKDLYTVISERKYGKNQKITRLDERTTLLECSMQNKDIIKSFVLGFGHKAKIIEPLWLKEEMEKELKEMLKKYEEAIK